MSNYDRLTDEEIIEKIRSGEEVAIDFLLDKYKSLVKMKAKAMYLIGGENDDLIQEGMIGLYKAIRDYRAEKEASFSSFASICISRQIYNAVQASNRKKHIPLNTYISFYVDINHASEEEIPLVEVMKSISDKSPEEIYIDRENVSAIEEKIEGTLSRFEKKILELHLTGLNYNQIAEILEKSPKSVDNALQRIKTKVSSLLK